MDNNYDVVVIGAGIAGANAANRLMQAGLKVAVLDKARGTGGRLSSKRLAGEDLSLPLGTAGFSGASGAMKRNLAMWRRQGSVSKVNEGKWRILTKFDRVDQVYQGTPRSSSLTRALLAGAELHLSSRVKKLSEVTGGWEVVLDNGDSLSARQVVLATPPAQAAAILPDQHLMVPQLSRVNMLPQWVVVVEVTAKGDNACVVNKLYNHPLVEQAIMQENMGSCDMAGKQVVLLHVCREWSQRNKDLDAQSVSDEVGAWVEGNRSTPNVEVLHVHRWLYAHCPEQQKLPRTHYWLPPTKTGCGGLGICGDYFDAKVTVSGGVEASVLSSERLCEDMWYSMMPVIQPA